MAYNTKHMLRDSSGTIIPQYFDKDKDQYEPFPDPTKVEVKNSLVSDFKTAVITITSTPVELTTGLANKKQLIIYPPDTGKIYWGSSQVTASTGAPLGVNDLPMEFPLADSNLKIYAVSDGTNRSVRIVEVTTSSPINEVDANILREELENKVDKDDPELVFKSEFDDLNTKLFSPTLNTDAFLDNNIINHPVWSEFGQRKINVKWFGAKGNGIDIDTLAIRNAINFCLSIGAILYFPKGIYKVDEKIIVNANITIQGHEARIINTGTQTKIFDFVGTLINTETNIISNASMYENQITLSNVQDIEIGDIIHVQSSMLWYYDNRDSLYKGETLEIIDIDTDTNKVTVCNGLSDGYNLSNETLVVKIYRPITISLKGIMFENGNIGMGYNIDSIIKNCKVDFPNSSVGISINTCVRTEVEKVIVKNCYETTTGYGIQDNASLKTKILNCHFSNNRRGVDFSGTTPSRYGLVENCTVEANGYNNVGTRIFTYSSGFGTHGTAEHITFRNNLVQDIREGFIIRGKSCSVQGNVFAGYVAFCVSFTYGDDLVVDANIYNSMRFFKTTTPEDATKYNSMGIFVVCSVETLVNNLTIKNNVLDVIRSNFLTIHFSITNLNMQGNQFKLSSNAGANKISVINGLTDRVGITISRLYYSGNNVQLGTGTYTERENVTVTTSVA